METADREARDINRVLQFEEKVAELSPEDIQEAANEFLTEDYLLGILMPEAAVTEE